MITTEQQVQAFIQAVMSSPAIAKWEIIGPHSSILPLGNTTINVYTATYTGSVGIRLNRKHNNTWHWFVYTEDSVNFFQSYNQSNGKSKGRRAYAHARAVRARVSNATGIEL